MLAPLVQAGVMTNRQKRKVAAAKHERRMKNHLLSLGKKKFWTDSEMGIVVWKLTHDLLLGVPRVRRETQVRAPTVKSDTLNQACKQHCSQHERATVADKGQRQADNRGGLDGHGNVDDDVRGKNDGGA